jgi:hypothetical protein
VTSQVATGVSWKFPVLAAVSQTGANDVQLDSTGDAVRQAIAFYLDGNATATDTFVISDGSVTETYTFKATATTTYDIVVGGSADATMVNIQTAINNDSGAWNARLVTELDSINDGSGTSTAGAVLVIFRTTQAASKYDRIYSSGANNTQANWQYVNFAGEDDYTKISSSQLPSADPAAKQFGPGTVTASLTAGEAHVALNNDAQYVWDADGAQWIQISGTGQITAGDGLTKDGNTIDFSNNGTGTFDGLVIAANSVGVAAADGVQISANYVTLLLEAAGADTGGLELTGTSPNKELRLDIDGTSTGAIASVMDLNANGLAINVDNSTIEGSAAGGVLRVKDVGITDAKLAVNAASVTKINLRFYEDSYAGSTFTTGGAGAYHNLSAQPLTNERVDKYNATFRNGVLDMTNVGAAGTPATNVQYRIYDTGTVGRVEIGADITADGHTYQMRYVAAHT